MVNMKIIAKIATSFQKYHGSFYFQLAVTNIYFGQKHKGNLSLSVLGKKFSKTCSAAALRNCIFYYFWLLLLLSLLWLSQNSFEFHRLSNRSVSKYWVADWFSAGQLRAQAVCFDERTTASLHCVTPEPFVCSCPNWSKINCQV